MKNWAYMQDLRKQLESAIQRAKAIKNSWYNHRTAADRRGIKATNSEIKTVQNYARASV